mgnify:CR=1 FL=1
MCLLAQELACDAGREKRLALEGFELEPAGCRTTREAAEHFEREFKGLQKFEPVSRAVFREVASSAILGTVLFAFCTGPVLAM